MSFYDADHVVMIDEKILLAFGADTIGYQRDEVIFEQGEKARYYYQIEEGEVKMCNISEKGSEFIQGIFSPGRCFGETPLFGDFGYPAKAVALTACTIWRMAKSDFFNMLRTHPEVHFKLTASIASRLYYKALMASEIGNEASTHRILKLLEYLKKDVYGLTEKYSYEVTLTRQQIADLTGQRVETAIRAIKKLEAEGLIKLEKRRIWI